MIDKEWLKNVLEQCTEYGYRTVPFFPKGHEVNGIKMPSRKFADGQDYKKVGQYTDAASVALVLENLVLLDYDGNKGDVMSVEELEEILDLDLVGMPTVAQVNDEGDSIHWLFKLPDGVSADELADSCDGAWPHIDIKRGNQLMHLKPHKMLNLLAGGDWEECPDAIIDKLKHGKGVNVVDSDDMGLLEAVEAQEDHMDFAKLVQLVGSLPLHRAEDHQSWYNVGMAIWYETRGSEEGLELFKTFSMQSEKYDEASLENRWPSFKHSVDRKPITGGSLHYWVEDAEFDNRLSVVSGLIERINAADEKHLMRDLPKEISKLDLNDFDREKLVVALKGRAKELTGVTMQISTAREMVAPSVAFGEFTDDMPKPVWCEPWVYVGTHGEFFHLDVDRHLSNDTFNMEFTKLVPVTGDNGQKASASRFVMNHGFIEVADRLEYLPTVTDRLVDLKGVTVFNSFDIRSLPKFDTKMTPEGLEAVKVIQDHIKMLCNDSAKDSKILEQWFAHQIQRKGIKILWCPLICSIEGTGKGLMEELLRRLLGSNNIRVVQPEQVKSNFKASWAVGSCVNILNELKVAGSNRHEVANSLKPMISDSSIRVEDKNVKSFEARNTANYLAYTNYLDAIPLTETSRRWWPVRMNLDNLNDIGSALGLSKDEYFDRLTGAIRNHWAQIGLWLSEYEISYEFTALKQAPETQFKLDMVATEGSKITGLEELEEVLREGGELITPKVVSLGAVYEALNAKLYGQEIITKRDLTFLMGRLGFTKRDKQVYVNGKQIVVWTKGSFEAEEIRGFLK
jgi:hypothetical protein